VLRELENVAASNDIVLQLHYNFDPDWVHHLVGLRLATFFDHEHVFVVDRADRLTYALLGNQSVDPRASNGRPVARRIIDLLPAVRASRTRCVNPRTRSTTRPSRPARRSGCSFHEPAAIVAGVGPTVRRHLPAHGRATPVCGEILDGQLLSDISARFDLPNCTARRRSRARTAKRHVASDSAGATIARFRLVPNQPGASIARHRAALHGDRIRRLRVPDRARRCANPPHRHEARRGREPPAPSRAARSLSGLPNRTASASASPP
jgi:sensor domain CHASE-containing protein